MAMAEQRALLAVECVGRPILAAHEAPPAQRPKVALVTYARWCHLAHERVAQDTTTLASLTHPPHSRPGGFSAQLQVVQVLGRHGRLLAGPPPTPKRQQWRAPTQSPNPITTSFPHVHPSSVSRSPRPSCQPHPYSPPSHPIASKPPRDASIDIVNAPKDIQYHVPTYPTRYTNVQGNGQGNTYMVFLTKRNPRSSNFLKICLIS